MLKLVPLLILLLSCSSIQKERERTIASSKEAYGYIYFVNEQKEEVAQIISFSSDRPNGDDGKEFSRNDLNFLQVEMLLNNDERGSLIGGRNQYLYKVENSEEVELTHCSKRYSSTQSYCRFPRINAPLKQSDWSYLKFQNKRYMKHPRFLEKGYVVKMDKLKKKQKKLLNKVSRELFISPSGKGLKVEFQGELLKDKNYDLIVKYIKYMYYGYPFRFYR